MGRRGRKHGGALLVMLVGTTAMVLLLATLNRPPPEKQDQGATDAVGFEVPPPPPPPPKVKRKKPRKKQKRAKAPPAPVMGASLSGLDLGLDAGGDDLLGELSEGLLGATGDVVMTEDAVDQPPQPVERRAPTYPSRARQKGVTGVVVLRILVSAAGDVLQVKVDRAEPPGVFEDAAVEAARTWRFNPATYHGAAVKTWVRQPVRFDLGAAG
jgi:protein TonB